MKGWTIFFVAFALYFVSIFGGFVQDDARMIFADPEMGQVSPLFASFARPYYYQDGNNDSGAYRPLTSFSFYLNALVTGKEAWGFRLVNVLFYAGLCFLVFEVLKKFVTLKTAFWGTLIFVVLPIHTEVVNNVVGRAEIMSLGFALLSVLMQFRKKWEISAGLFLLALFSKETAVVSLPVLLYLLIEGREKRDTKIGVSIFYVMVAISYMILRIIVSGGGGFGNNASIVENPLKYVPSELRVMNAFSLVPFGVGKIIFPVHLSYDYSFNQLKLITNWFDWRVLLGIGMVIFSGVYMYRLLHLARHNSEDKHGITMSVLGLILFWGPIFITGNFLFPIGTIFGERLWFWSSLGLIMIIMSLFPFRSNSLLVTNKSLLEKRRNWLKNKNFKDLVLIIVIVSIYFLRTEKRNVDWLSQERLFFHDAIYAKDSVMVQNNAAAMYLLGKDYKKGKVYLERAREIYPKYQMLMNNWGMFYVLEGDKKLAKEVFEDCLNSDPTNALCESNLELVK